MFYREQLCVLLNITVICFCIVTHLSICCIVKLCVPKVDLYNLMNIRNNVLCLDKLASVLGNRYLVEKSSLYTVSLRLKTIYIWNVFFTKDWNKLLSKSKGNAIPPQISLLELFWCLKTCSQRRNQIWINRWPFFYV